MDSPLALLTALVSVALALAYLLFGMRVIYESFDAMIRYGVLNAENQDVWQSHWNTNGNEGTSGPASAEEETSAPLGSTMSGLNNAYADIDFYGSSCKVLGWALDVNVTVELDGEKLPFTPPADTDATFFTLNNQPVGWHTLRFISTSISKETPYLAITRAIIDTGIPEAYAVESTFKANSKEWSTKGDWARRAISGVPSLTTEAINASATLRSSLAESSMLFLYGLIDPGAGLFDVSWLEADTAALAGEPPTRRRSWQSLSSSDRLLYMGIVPKGGAKGLVVAQADNRVGPFLDSPSLTFTQLEVWKSTGQIEPVDGSGSLTIGSQSNTAAPTSSMTPTELTPSLSPAMIGGIISGLIGLLAISGTIIFIFMRRRGQSRSKGLQTSSSPTNGDHSLRPFVAELPIATVEPPRPAPRRHVHEKRHVLLETTIGEKRELASQQEVVVEVEEAGPSTGWQQFAEWATSSAPAASAYDPDAQSVSAAISPTDGLNERRRRRRSSVAGTEVALEDPPVYEETGPNS